MYPRIDEHTGLYGFWCDDRWVIKPTFEYANRFCGGYAAVDNVDGRSCLIDFEGSLFPLQAICGGGLPVKNEGFTFTGFSEDDMRMPMYAKILIEVNGKREWGLIDSNLIYLPLDFPEFAHAKDVKPIMNRVIMSFLQSGGAGMICGVFNFITMEVDIPVEYSAIYPSNDSIWVVSKLFGDKQQDVLYAFYDVIENKLLPGWFLFASPFSCGFGAIRIGDWTSMGKSQFVDKNLHPVFNSVFDSVGPFSFGLAAVYTDGDSGYIDTSGNMQLLLPYENLQPFNEFGLAIANRNEDEWDIDIIDRRGQVKLGNLETAVFVDGNFPYFRVTKNNNDHIYDIKLKKIF